MRRVVQKWTSGADSGDVGSEMRPLPARPHPVVLRAKPALTPTELIRQRLALGLDRSELARLLGIGKTTLGGWERGSHAILGPVTLALDDIRHGAKDQRRKRRERELARESRERADSYRVEPDTSKSW
jgi:DNA-binding transcriptional regulator YiaG